MKYYVFTCCLLFGLSVFGQGESRIHAAQISASGATNGQALLYDAATDEWIPSPLPTGADNWGAQTVQTDATLTGDGTAGDLLGVVQSAIKTSLLDNDEGFITNPDDADASLINELQRPDPLTSGVRVGFKTTSPDGTSTGNVLVRGLNGIAVRHEGTSVDGGVRLEIDGSGIADDQALSRLNNQEVELVDGGGPVNIVVGKTKYVDTPASGNVITLSPAIDMNYVNSVSIVRGIPQSIATSGSASDVTISPDGTTVTFNQRSFDSTQGVTIIYIAAQ